VAWTFTKKPSLPVCSVLELGARDRGNALGPL
jgi:hypothetical protein